MRPCRLLKSEIREKEASKKRVVGEERTRISKNANAVSLENAIRLLNYMTQIYISLSAEREVYGVFKLFRFHLASLLRRYGELLLSISYVLTKYIVEN
jgi:hypothetical protein